MNDKEFEGVAAFVLISAALKHALGGENVNSPVGSCY